MRSSRLPETHPEPARVEGLMSPEALEMASHEMAWVDDMEGLYEFGLDPWLAERLRQDSETAEISFPGADRILDELSLD